MKDFERMFSGGFEFGLDSKSFPVAVAHDGDRVTAY